MAKLSATDWKWITMIGLLTGIFDYAANHFLPHGYWQPYLYAFCSGFLAVRTSMMFFRSQTSKPSVTQKQNY